MLPKAAFALFFKDLVELTLEGISRAKLDLRHGYVLGKTVDKYLALSENQEKRFAAEVALDD